MLIYRIWSKKTNKFHNNTYYSTEARANAAICVSRLRLNQIAQSLSIEDFKAIEIENYEVLEYEMVLKRRIPSTNVIKEDT